MGVSSGMVFGFEGMSFFLELTAEPTLFLPYRKLCHSVNSKFLYITLFDYYRKIFDTTIII